MAIDEVLNALPFVATVTAVLVDRADKVVLEAVAGERPVVVKWDASAVQSAKEGEVLKLADAAGVPVPGVVAALDNLLVIERVAGRPLRPTDSGSLWRQAGAALRMLHGLAGAPSGTVQAVEPPGDRFADFIAWWAGDVTGKVERSGVLPPGQVRRLGQHCKALLAEVEPPERVLQHGDPRVDHFLVDGDRLAGVIDLGDASINDPAWDIATLTAWWPERADDVVAGYDPTPHVRDHLNRYLPGYRLLRLLGDVAWQHAHHGDTTVTVRELRRQHPDILA